MSQRAMEAGSGLMHGYISRIEQGKVEICLGSIQAICETLGVSIAELFKGSEPQNKAICLLSTAFCAAATTSRLMGISSRESSSTISLMVTMLILS